MKFSDFVFYIRVLVQSRRKPEATGQVKSALHLTGTGTALKYINLVVRAGGKRCTNVEARASQVRRDLKVK